MSSGEADASPVLRIMAGPPVHVRIKHVTIPAPIDDIIARLESMTDDPAILARELRRLGIDYPGDADREDD